MAATTYADRLVLIGDGTLTIPTYWFNLDIGRTQKRVGFVFDVGKWIKPVITPDDPAAFRDALTASGVPVENEALPVSSPTA